MSPESVAGLTEQIRAKLRSRKSLEPSEYGFLEHLADQEFGGTSDGDPVFKWIERQHDWEAEVGKATGMNARAARTRFSEIEDKQKAGQPVTRDDQAFLRKYQQGVDSWKAGETGERSKEKLSFGRRIVKDLLGTGPDIGKPKQQMGNAVCGAGSAETKAELAEELRIARMARMDAGGGTMANKGWTDEARAAALAIRQAKAAARKTMEDGKRKTEGGEPRRGNLEKMPGPEVKDGIYLGGSPYFDEVTGQYVYPPNKRKVPGKPGQPVRPSPPGGVVPRWPPGKPVPPFPGKPKKGDPVPIKPPYRFLGGASR
jgi:hypothetical protein